MLGDFLAPPGLMRGSWQFWLSTMATNLAITAIVATIIWLVGLGPFLLVQLPTTILAGSIGVWLFYVQHQFEDTFWAQDEGWISTRRRCTAARIMTCQASCAGSPPISVCTVSTIFAAASRITDCPKYYGITRSSLPSGG
jgi:hypothetical protein